MVHCKSVQSNVPGYTPSTGVPSKSVFMVLCESVVNSTGVLYVVEYFMRVCCAIQSTLYNTGDLGTLRVPSKSVIMVLCESVAQYCTSVTPLSDQL